MKWLRKKIIGWVREDWYSSQPVCESVDSPVVGSRGVDVEGLSFNVMPAQGGTVVQIRHYDRKTDRHNYITHVIPEGEDISERIGQIVSMELLRA
jgi:hypothetical protein